MAIKKFYITLLVIINIASFILFLYCLTGNLNHEISGYYFLNTSIIVGIGYIYCFRKNHLFCFETIFITMFILSTYFFEIVINNLVDDSNVSEVLSRQFSTLINNKSVILQSLGLYCFLLGASLQNIKKTGYKKSSKIKYNYRFYTNSISFLTTLLIVFLFLSGNIFSWFQYSGSSNNYSNEYIVYLTVFFLVYTALEFSLLSQLKCDSLKSFLKKADKIYLIEMALISMLLLVSGNRNEALLILLPPVIAYCIYVKFISNKIFIVLLSAGVVSMVFIGLTRQNKVSAENVLSADVSLYKSTRDYAFVEMSSKYLISYADNKSPIFFNNTVLNIFSSIPLIGGIYAGSTGAEFDTRSVDITTDGMQTIENRDSGLGTSLIGDLYYTASWPFVILYMYLFGKLMSYLFNRFVVYRDYNIWLLIIYLFLFANCVYCVRAEWTMPIRYLGFSFSLLSMLILIGQIIEKRKILVINYGK